MTGQATTSIQITKLSQSHRFPPPIASGRTNCCVRKEYERHNQLQLVESTAMTDSSICRVARWILNGHSRTLVGRADLL